MMAGAQSSSKLMSFLMTSRLQPAMSWRLSNRASRVVGQTRGWRAPLWSGSHGRKTKPEEPPIRGSGVVHATGRQYNHIGLPGRGGSRQAIPSCDPTAAAPVAFEQCNYCGLNWPFWISLVTAASHRVVASHS